MSTMESPQQAVQPVSEAASSALEVPHGGPSSELNNKTLSHRSTREEQDEVSSLPQMVDFSDSSKGTSSTTTNNHHGPLSAVDFPDDVEDQVEAQQQEAPMQTRSLNNGVPVYTKSLRKVEKFGNESDWSHTGGNSNNPRDGGGGARSRKSKSSDNSDTSNSGGGGSGSKKNKSKLGIQEQENQEVVLHVVPLYMKLAVSLSLVFGITGTLVGILALIHANNAVANNSLSGNVSQQCTELSKDSVCIVSDGEPPNLLNVIYDRGFVNCGFAKEQLGFVAPSGAVDAETGELPLVGFEIDLCRAVAAALFDGDATAYQTTVLPSSDPGWALLNATAIDVLFHAVRNLEQEVHEPRISTGGVKFSSPYFYDGLEIAGLKDFVECAESGIVNGTCTDLKICVLDKGSNAAVITNELLLPSENLLVVDSEPTFYTSFPFVCNVLAGEKGLVAESTVRNQGYNGDYMVGMGTYSRQPYSMATRRGDDMWTDFLESVLTSVIFAEEEGITKVTSSNMPTTKLFDPRFEHMFQNAVSAAGSYGELYAKNLQAYLPRDGMNRLNRGDTPRIWSIPFGDLAEAGPSLEAMSPTVKAIKERGFLGCGHGIVLGLSEFDSATQDYKGFQVDLCRALSAALFDGVDHTVFTTFFFPRRFDVVNQGPVDVLFSTSNNLQRNTFVPELDQGMTFSATYHYVGITFGGIPLFVDCAIRLDTFSPECQSLRVCVRAGTATVKRFSEIVRGDYLLPLDSFPEMYRALGDGRCNTILAGAIQIQEPVVRARGYGYEGPYALATTFFSTENLAVGTKDDDPVWSAFVASVVNAIIYAEENGIDQSSAALMPQSNLWGHLRNRAFFHAVNMVGNFGEIYERNFGTRLPRIGRHLLNDNSDPRIYSNPGVRV